MVRNKLCRDASYTVGHAKQRKVCWTGTSSFVLEVPLRYLRPSIIYSVPRYRVAQRAYYELEELATYSLGPNQESLYYSPAKP